MSGGARRLLRAEWTKARTLGSTGWLIAAVVVLTVAPGAAVAATTRCSAGRCDGDPVQLSLGGVQLGQVAVVLLAVLLVGGEYGTGTMQATLIAAPRRDAVLAAKAALLGTLVLPAAAVGVGGSLLAGSAALDGTGFGEPAVVLRAGGGSVLYLALIALLALGVGFAVRNSVAAIGIVLGLLYLAPIVAGVVTDERWQRHLQQAAPMSAGLAVQATDVAELPIGPWAGLAVLAGWAAAALLAGALALRLRDA